MTQLNHTLYWLLLKPTKHESTSQPLPILLPVLATTSSHVPRGSLISSRRVCSRTSCPGRRPLITPFEIAPQRPLLPSLSCAPPWRPSPSDMPHTSPQNVRSREQGLCFIHHSTPITMAHIVGTLAITFLRALMYGSFNLDESHT